MNAHEFRRRKNIDQLAERVREMDDPLGASEVMDELDVTRQTALGYIRDLGERDGLKTEKSMRPGRPDVIIEA